MRIFRCPYRMLSAEDCWCHVAQWVLLTSRPVGGSNATQLVLPPANRSPIAAHNSNLAYQLTGRRICLVVTVQNEYEN